MKFREFILEEGEFLDAVCVGFKAFSKERKKQAKKTEFQKMSDDILSAEGADLQRLVQKIVDNGYSVKNGKVVKPPKHKSVSKEIFECTSTKKA